VYRGTMAATLPTSVAPNVTDAALKHARRCGRGRRAVARPLGAEVLDTARDAFAQSFDVTVVLTAAVLITASLVTLV
jgi:hypothetical protein